ncbi:MAG TPA: tRNA pseudouridine(55) synthase TruB [Chitinophagales bacterium]|nr:tRNA pseudouridine(55) synthase TruB [Chitinophagales bacterium]
MILPAFSNAILLFNKPLSWTSFDVVNKVKILTRMKIGHAGTLDPLATGLLILCTGSLTKKISDFQSLDKEYTGTMRLGATTPSFDLEREVDERFDISHITDEMIFDAAKKFIGTQEQLPPAHSAKHHDGSRYYDLAREGKAFDLKPHTVTLNEFEIMRISLPEVDFKIVCGKGFYVRSLVNDFGRALKAGAHLSSLCRTRIGDYHLKDAWQVEDFTKFVREQKEKLRSPLQTKNESPQKS